MLIIRVFFSFLFNFDIRVFVAHTPVPHLSASTFCLKIKTSIGSSCYDWGRGWNPIELTLDFTLWVVIYSFLLGFWFTLCTFEVLCGFEGGCLAFHLPSLFIFEVLCGFEGGCLTFHSPNHFIFPPILMFSSLLCAPS
jgi:hypothetical protein